MFEKMRSPLILSGGLALLMFVQAALGLLFPGRYRDAAWIQAAWWGNDWVTLLVAFPLLVVAILLVRRGSVRGFLLWLGMLGYAFYNMIYYLFGAALNAFFPLYVAVLILASVVLILAFSRTNPALVAAHFRRQTPVRLAGGYLIFVGFGLGAIWLLMWAAYIFAGRATPVEPEAFKVVATIDMAIIAPLLLVGGVLFWRRKVWGSVLAPVAGVLGTIYLFVLSVNSFVAMRRGLVEAPGELPIWGTLVVLTLAITLVMLANVQSAPEAARIAGPVVEKSDGEGLAIEG